ncbi:asparagine synthase (glutamine-hydrolyzing) [Xenococcus sp. PCC 7305]|uniref:asparagine synthase-related protein n=1 Tax=Xenococcus sp. PCC 7305 TaxID=102125 RepID=UPI0002ACE0B4|nr:asparagine synthase-related protein [Xenococcus sp. PCC 7305]ELS05346.1 asparagine synthase (glutamine-hydrolyzing) [Xenococcus sp. PCC 7305]
MSAIAGIYYQNGQPVKYADLESMFYLLAHRGFDAGDIWYKKNIGLVNRLLFTTPESKQERLPLHDRKSNLILTAEARIDNREELLSVLRLKTEGIITDSQIILAAYQKWGEDCPIKLIGDFAFAIWDQQKQKLFCARDTMGVKPFYYYYSGCFFAFASEAKALLELPSISCQVNEAKIGLFLAQLGGFSAYKADSFYHNIQHLPPGHWLKVDDKGVRLNSYWDWHDAASKIQSELKCDQDYIEAFRERFSQAVACRLRSAYPLVSALSGGLDSSSVSCVAKKLLGNRESLTTIYADCGMTSTDETAYVNAVLAQGGFSHQSVLVKDAISSAKIVASWLDRPLQMPTAAVFLATINSVKNQGARVFLTGHDGDTIVSHGIDYPYQVQSDNWQELHNKFVFQLVQGKNFTEVSLDNLINHQLVNPNSLKLYRKNLLRERLVSRKWQDKNSTINPDFAQKINLEELMKREIDYQSAYLPSVYLNHFRGVISDNMQVGTAQIELISSANGIELRHPFLDRRLIELCLAVPAHLKNEAGMGRGVMRRAMKGILPRQVCQRKDKVDFYGFIIPEMARNEQELIERYLFDERSQLAKYVDLKALKNNYQQFLTSEKPWQERRREAKIIASTTFLSIWLNQLSSTPIAP